MKNKMKHIKSFDRFVNESYEINERRKTKPFKKVMTHDTAVDYNGEELMVMDKGKLKDLESYDSTGALDDDYLDKNELGIAVQDKQGRTYVYTYDVDGAVVYESLIEESAKSDKLVKAWLAMDIENVGNEEEDIKNFSNNKEIEQSLDKLTSKMSDNEIGQHSAAMEILLKESINEGSKLMDEETGKIVKLPYKTVDFRGDPIEVINYTDPHKPSSSGRIIVRGGNEYFPGVAGLKIVGHKYDKTNESIDESKIPSYMPNKVWELTIHKSEDGTWAVAKYKGKYYGGYAEIEGGSVNSIADVHNIEVIDKKEYDDADL